ncbi:alpha-1,3-glucosyltransferase [Blastomyces parvus]|uniref:Alpha-1,3-glucosyltransferase n=1 Tax=Blastomyces parvus TaxID=2060905 RepID=A0A2B7XH01_9EURO|nr:alpha-1,3-glucosyltransferase [Blastomyces parvus]
MGPSASPSPSHRPRKKRRLLSTAAPHSNVDLISNAASSKPSPAFPIVSFLWPARAGVSQWVVLPLILMVVGLFRWSVSLWGYSGQSIPPMYGDFEAQRHWMEITSHLPIASWYFYDLQWWGLDYPPLTAYHSWLLGKIGSIIDPSWFALDDSRGIEGPLLKVYMRATVVVSEYLVYIPAVVIFLRRYSRMQGTHVWASSIALIAILMQPATILVDHGHFQYNTVMLGLVVAALECMVAGRMLWASLFFVSALCFKQMALYFAPAIFAFMLGACFSPRVRLGRLMCISLITILAFGLMFAPFIITPLYNKYRGIELSLPSPPLLQNLPVKLDESSWMFPPVLQLAQAIYRIFPFSRGLFEDKVANVWCAIHTFYKLNRFPSALLQRASLGATVLSIATPCTLIGLYPRPTLLLPALASTAWGFFLFSFQVHEKSVLLPLLPMTLLLGNDRGLSKETRAWVGLANMLGVWTLFPLLRRDELRVPYFVLTLLWAYLLGLPPTSLDLYRNESAQSSESTQEDVVGNLHVLTKILHLIYYLSMIFWHILEAFVATPAGKPDLWVVLNVLIGASGFGILYLWCTWKLIQQAGLIRSFAASKASNAQPVTEEKKRK